MGNRMNFAPRMPTILIALALMVIALLATFAGALPPVAGLAPETYGPWAFVVAAAVLLAGMLVEGI